MLLVVSNCPQKNPQGHCHTPHHGCHSNHDPLHIQLQLAVAAVAAVAALVVMMNAIQDSP